MYTQNIARVQNCLDITLLTLSFCPFFLFLICFSLFFFSSLRDLDQMAERAQVSKVILCVQILNWHPVSDEDEDDHV